MKAQTAEYERGIAGCEFEVWCVSTRSSEASCQGPHHIAARAGELFELRDNALVVKNGESDLNDPLVPLIFTKWLQEYRKTS